MPYLGCRLRENGPDTKPSISTADTDAFICGHPEIVSCLARCAWLDEADRLNNKTGDVPRVSVEWKTYADAMEAALDNAELWGEWGRA